MESWNHKYSSSEFNNKYFKNSILFYITSEGKMTIEPLNLDQAHIWFPPHDAYIYAKFFTKPNKIYFKEKIKFDLFMI
jgi:hypothetical protein